MNARRLLPLLLVASTVLAFAACGDDDREDVTDDGALTPAAVATTVVVLGETPTEQPSYSCDIPLEPTPAPAAPPEVQGEVVTTESGLQYIDICVGNGDMPSEGSQVLVWYTGWLQADGTKFDSSLDRGEPTVFAVTQVIQGFGEGLLSMREGGQRRLIIPPELGYGEAGSGPVPGNATLIFDVTLLDFVP